MDEPLAGVYRDGSSFRVLYWVTDGSGRQLSVADAQGVLQSTDVSGLQSQWKYAGATKSGNTFGAERSSGVDNPTISYFRNRAYDQETGRWTQEDPIGVAGGLNLYQFNGNNPVAYSDPFGLSPCRDILKKAALICALVDYAGAVIGSRSHFDKHFPSLPSGPGRAAGSVSKGLGHDLRTGQGYSMRNPPTGNSPPSRGLTAPTSNPSLERGLEALVDATPLIAAVGGPIGAVAGVVAAAKDVFPGAEVGHDPVRCRVERCDGVQTPVAPPGGTLEPRY